VFHALCGCVPIRTLPRGWRGFPVQFMRQREGHEVHPLGSLPAEGPGSVGVRRDLDGFITDDGEAGWFPAGIETSTARARQRKPADVIGEVDLGLLFDGGAGGGGGTLVIGPQPAAEAVLFLAAPLVIEGDLAGEDDSPATCAICLPILRAVGLGGTKWRSGPAPNSRPPSSRRHPVERHRPGP
jgi:hypothetical protein